MKKIYLYLFVSYLYSVAYHIRIASPAIRLFVATHTIVYTLRRKVRATQCARKCGKSVARRADMINVKLKQTERTRHQDYLMTVGKH